MCGPLLGGAWWIFPLVGIAMCVGFMLLMAGRFGRNGRGCMCMGGHDSRQGDHDDAPRPIDAAR